MSRKKNSVKRGVAAYLSELVDYGGVLMTRGAVMEDLKRMGGNPEMIDVYMVGLKTREGK